MHAKSGLRVVLKWKILRPDSVIAAVIPLTMFELPSDFEWLAPWSALTDDADPDALEGGQIQAELESGQTIAGGLVAELRREIPANHRLAECHQLRVIGRCDADHNEFLFATDDTAAPIACVHLTWRTETDPRWPHADLYASVAEWDAQMKRENAGLTKTTLPDGE